MSHTPGPWKVGEETVFHADAGRGKIFALPIEEDRPDDVFVKDICYVVVGADANSAEDARLIAAAPDLLTALFSCLAALNILFADAQGNMPDEVPLPIGVPLGIKAIASMAGSAIIKAGGYP